MNARELAVAEAKKNHKPKRTRVDPVRGSNVSDKNATPGCINDFLSRAVYFTKNVNVAIMV